MSKVFENRLFECWYDQDSGRVFEGFVFRRCSFLSCAISITKNPKLRSTVRNVVIEDCEVRGSSVRSAIIEDTVVDGLKTHNGTLDCWGAVYKHVTIRGRIGGLFLTNHMIGDPPEVQKAFDDARMAYYANVDWALDISEAEFSTECCIRGVPADLIRRDPETQAIIRRWKVLDGAWREIDMKMTGIDVVISYMLDNNFQDIIVVAAKRSRHFKSKMECIERLRKAGIAE